MFKHVAQVLAVAALLSISTSAFAERKAPSRTPREVSGSININTATPAQLELLPGVGRKTARLIVDHRAKKPFKAPAEILEINGVGEATWRKVKPYVTVSGPTTLTPGKTGAPATTPEPSASLPAEANVPLARAK